MGNVRRLPHVSLALRDMGMRRGWIYPIRISQRTPEKKRLVFSVTLCLRGRCFLKPEISLQVHGKR